MRAVTPAVPPGSRPARSRPRSGGGRGYGQRLASGGAAAARPQLRRPRVCGGGCLSVSMPCGDSIVVNIGFGQKTVESLPLDGMKSGRSRLSTVAYLLCAEIILVRGGGLVREYLRDQSHLNR